MGQHVLAVTLVAGALCADRLAVAAPLSRPQVGQMARQLVSRLSVGFRQVLPEARLDEPRRERPAGEIAVAILSTPVVIHASEFSPFQFRLPPPIA